VLLWLCCFPLLCIVRTQSPVIFPQLHHVWSDLQEQTPIAEKQGGYCSIPMVLYWELATWYERGTKFLIWTHESRNHGPHVRGLFHILLTLGWRTWVGCQRLFLGRSPSRVSELTRIESSYTDARYDYADAAKLYAPDHWNPLWRSYRLMQKAFSSSFITITIKLLQLKIFTTRLSPCITL
jgi:hypothetical protein